ncbi:MAG: CPBP family glutamic-type intramembrane protease [Candidatus Nanoarchaeia archaeon]
MVSENLKTTFIGKTKEGNRITISIIIGLMFLLGIIMILIPPLREALFMYLALLMISYFVYRSPQYQDDTLVFSKRNAFSCIILAGILVPLFYYGTKVIPGFSFGIPLLPGTISEGMKAFIVIFVAPVVETLFVQGAFLAYIKNFHPSKKWLYTTLVIQALVFGFIHLTAYIAGFYSLPSWSIALGEFWATIGSFLAAIVWALIAGFVVMMDGVRNLLFVTLFHMGVNLFIFTELTIVGLSISPNLIKLIVTIL